MNKFFFLSLLIFGVISCTPKVAAVVEEVPEEVKPKYEGNCPSFADISPAEKDQAETAYVLDKDFLRAKDYDESYKYWQTAMRIAPRSNGKIQYQFEDGLKIFKHYHDQETDTIKKKEWAQKAMDLYAQRIECFGDEYYLAFKALTPIIICIIIKITHLLIYGIDINLNRFLSNCPAIMLETEKTSAT